MSTDSGNINEKEVWQACRDALQTQAAKSEFSLDFDKTLDVHLRHALEPIANKRGDSIDLLVPAAQQIIKTDQVLASALKILRNGHELLGRLDKLYKAQDNREGLRRVAEQEVEFRTAAKAMLRSQVR
jgi:hypothetical protein